MDKRTIGFLVFFAAIFAARFINERALKKLSEAEAARLLQGFSRFRMYSLGAVIGIVAMFFAYSNLYPGSTFRVAQLFMGVLVAFLISTGVAAYLKLKKMQMPDSYVNSFLLASFVKYAGVFIFFGLSIAKYS